MSTDSTHHDGHAVNEGLDGSTEASNDMLGGGAGADPAEDQVTRADGVTPEGDDLASRLDVDPERGDVKG